MTPPPAQKSPWSEYRTLAETLGQAVADAASVAIGSHVDLGIATAGDPEEMVSGRPLPLRGIVVQFRRPLRDAMIFITSLKEDAVRPMVEAAAHATLAAMDVPTTPDEHGPLGRFVIEDAVELDTVEVALEQLDALFLEATYSLELPMGEVQVVFGTGLLESLSSFVNGVADPFAVEVGVIAPSDELELADSIGLGEDARLELGDDVAAQSSDSSLQFAGAGAAASSGVEQFDAMLAAQEQADAEAAALVAAGAAATASANVAAAAELPQFTETVADTSRWTELLSGVEVELSAELGRADLALGDITALAAESVLTLDQMVNEPVTVYVNGTRYATARLVVVDGEYGIEIIEVVEQEAFIPSLAA